ncbi:ABC transporter ATP-binding protein [Streptomyces millisiae]|uniref:ABC transporter ATP-binding protein n=1 Tax=Streptomyces millisiae TaxID=3075542 RepID=A0ABU2LZZ3_9ACTN|nr:ABC transporter ATP-binding protein [Streptomyces sp. DSM 44918]MDT0323170.1 ABC transporter ATP-binding protein [Streptomyces sp. DSM 44918]
MRSLWRLRPYVRPVRGRVFLAVPLAVVASCLALLMPLVLKWMVDGPVSDGHAAGVWLGGGVLLLLGVVEAGIFGVRRWLTARPLAAVEASMRETLHDHLLRLPVAFHDRWSSGQLVSRGTADLGSLHGFLAVALPFLVVNGVTLLVGCVLLLAQRWSLGLVLLAPVLPLLALCSFLETRFALAARQAREQTGELTTMARESVLGVRVVKSFGHHRALTRAFRRHALLIHGTELAKARLLAALSALVALLPNASLGAALVLGAVRVADGELSAGTLLAFLAIALELRPVVASTGSLLALSSDAATAADRHFEVLDEPAPADDAPARHRTAPTAGTSAADVVFEGVEFRYPDAPPGEPAVLRGVSLRIAPGETVALVGATGSGKSTLVALVPRLHEPTGGRILLDGTDVTALTRAELRRQVSVAFEEPTLFSTTVAENVLLGAEHADAEDLARALGVAQADGFVQALPDGALTHVGEQGMSLSGGQRQRLALARAVVGRPRLLVLDDPLSALDIHTEALVEAALRRVLSTTTALVVAHRPSTVSLADRVALLSGGRITAVGTHDELLRTCAEYAALMSAFPTDGGGAR